MLTEEKEFLKLEELRQVNIPKYDECSVKNIYPRIWQNPTMMRYFPDRLPQGKLPDREYFFNILMTKFPEYTEKMVNHANSLRFSSAMVQDHMD